MALYSDLYRPRGGVEIYRHPYAHVCLAQDELTRLVQVLVVKVKVALAVTQWIGKRMG